MQSVCYGADCFHQQLAGVAVTAAIATSLMGDLLRPAAEGNPEESSPM